MAEAGFVAQASDGLKYLALRAARDRPRRSIICSYASCKLRQSETILN